MDGVARSSCWPAAGDVYRHHEHLRVSPYAAAPLRSGAARSAPQVPDAGTDPGRFLFVVASFALAALASAGFAANLVPALGERGASTATAAMLGGLMGVMQLPGRALLMNGAGAGSPARLVAASLLLHAFGLAAVAFAPSMLVRHARSMRHAKQPGRAKWT